MKNILMRLSIAALALQVAGIYSPLSALEVTASIADFHPVSSIVKKVYRSNMPLYRIGLEYDYNDSIALVINGNYVEAKGRSRGEHNATFFNMWTLFPALKYSHKIWGNLDGFVSAGPTYSFMSMTDHSPYVRKKTKKGSLGVAGEAGVSHPISSTGFMRLFLGYSYVQFHNSGSYHCDEENRINLSAIIFGGTIGFTF